MNRFLLTALLAVPVTTHAIDCPNPGVGGAFGISAMTVQFGDPLHYMIAAQTNVPAECGTLVADFYIVPPSSPPLAGPNYQPCADERKVLLEESAPLSPGVYVSNGIYDFGALTRSYGSFIVSPDDDPDGDMRLQFSLCALVRYENGVGIGGTSVTFGAGGSNAPLLVAPTCPGDINHDNRVTTDDLLALINNWGNSGQGDLNYNGVVNTDDLTTLLAHWGPCPAQDGGMVKSGGEADSTQSETPNLTTPKAKKVNKLRNGLKRKIGAHKRKKA